MICLHSNLVKLHLPMKLHKLWQSQTKLFSSTFIWKKTLNCQILHEFEIYLLSLAAANWNLFTFVSAHFTTTNKILKRKLDHVIIISSLYQAAKQKYWVQQKKTTKEKMNETKRLSFRLINTNLQFIMVEANLTIKPPTKSFNMPKCNYIRTKKYEDSQQK